MNKKTQNPRMDHQRWFNAGIEQPKTNFGLFVIMVLVLVTMLWLAAPETALWDGYLGALVQWIG